MVSLTKNTARIICHSLQISLSLDFKNAKCDDFRNFRTILRKNFLVTGETETKNVYSKVCRNKTGICFFHCGPVCFHNAFVCWVFRRKLSYMQMWVYICIAPNPSQKVFSQWMNQLFKLFPSIRSEIFKWKKNVFNRNIFLLFNSF